MTIANRSWAARRDVVITLVGWIGILWVLMMVLGRVQHTLFLFVFAALIAYVLDPLIRRVELVLPRPIAVLVVYLLVIGSIALLLYFVVDTAVAQITSFVPTMQALLNADDSGAGSSSLVRTLERAGVSHERIVSASQQLTAEAQSLSGSLLPIVEGTFGSLLDTALVVILSVYLVLDGQRVIDWLKSETPQSLRSRIVFLLDTFEQVVGGYVRGQLLLSTIIGVLVGGGMAVLGVPDALLLGIVAFFFAFIPIIGTFVSGAACVLLALTQGFWLAVIVLAYFVIIHVIEGDVLGPRVVGRAVGLPPVVAILAVITGSALFGITGALLADPVTGVGLAIVQALWMSWKSLNPEEFAEEREKVEEVVDEALVKN